MDCDGERDSFYDAGRNYSRFIPSLVMYAPVQMIITILVKMVVTLKVEYIIA